MCISISLCLSRSACVATHLVKLLSCQNVANMLKRVFANVGFPHSIQKMEEALITS